MKDERGGIWWLLGQAPASRLGLILRSNQSWKCGWEVGLEETGTAPSHHSLSPAFLLTL